MCRLYLTQIREAAEQCDAWAVRDLASCTSGLLSRTLAAVKDAVEHVEMAVLGEVHETKGERSDSFGSTHPIVQRKPQHPKAVFLRRKHILTYMWGVLIAAGYGWTTPEHKTTAAVVSLLFITAALVHIVNAIRSQRAQYQRVTEHPSTSFVPVAVLEEKRLQQRQIKLRSVFESLKSHLDTVCITLEKSYIQTKQELLSDADLLPVLPSLLQRTAAELERFRTFAASFALIMELLAAIGTLPKRPLSSVHLETTSTNASDDLADTDPFSS